MSTSRVTYVNFVAALITGWDKPTSLIIFFSVLIQVFHAVSFEYFLTGDVIFYCEMCSSESCLNCNFVILQAYLHDEFLCVTCLFLAAFNMFRPIHYCNVHMTHAVFQKHFLHWHVCTYLLFCTAVYGINWSFMHYLEITLFCITLMICIIVPPLSLHSDCIFKNC